MKKIPASVKTSRKINISQETILNKRLVFSEGNRGVPALPTLMILSTASSYLEFFLRISSTVQTVFTKRKEHGEERKKVGKDNDQRVKPEKTDITCFFFFKKNKRTIKNFALLRCSWNLPVRVYSHCWCKPPELETAYGQPLSNLDHIKTSCSSWWLIKMHQDT